KATGQEKIVRRYENLNVRLEEYSSDSSWDDRISYKKGENPTKGMKSLTLHVKLPGDGLVYGRRAYLLVTGTLTFPKQQSNSFIDVSEPLSEKVEFTFATREEVRQYAQANKKYEEAQKAYDAAASARKDSGIEALWATLAGLGTGLLVFGAIFFLQGTGDKKGVPLTEIDVTISLETSRGNPSSQAAGVAAEEEGPCPTQS